MAPRHVMIVCVLLLLFSGGCDKPKSAPPKPGPASEAEAEDPSEVPDLEGELAEGASPVLVEPRDPSERIHPVYVQEADLPAGGLLGLCYVPAKKPLKLKSPPAVEIKTGPDAIVEPEPKELDYYGKIKLHRLHWLAPHNPDQGGHPVLHAVLLLRGVKKGPKEPLRRGGFQVNNGAIRPVVVFTPLNDRAEVRTLDAFSNRLVLSDLASEKVVWQEFLPGNTATFRGHGALDKDKLIAWNRTQWLKLAKPVQTPPIRKPGFYRLTCRRHPWQEAYLVVVDSPYVAVPQDRHRRWGIFSMTAIPAGTWELEVWHPELEPVERTLSVEIKADETLELRVPFKPPAGVE
jgi:hypothetical protein